MGGKPATSPNDSLFLLRLMVEHLETQGRDGPGFAKSMGYSQDELAQETRANFDGQIWTRFEEAGASPCAGLELAGKTNAGTLGIFGYLTARSPTVEDSLRRVQQFLGLVTRRLSYHLHKDSEDAFFEYRLGPGNPPSALRDQFLVGVPHTQLMLYGPGWTPRKVTFVGPASPHAAAYEAFFGAPVCFEAPRAGLHFDASFLNQPIPESDSALVAILERCAREELAKMAPVEPPFLTEARTHCADLLKRGDVTLESLAQSLGLSRRSLQRRLREHDTSHRQLLDELRHRLAQNMLAENEASLFEIAMCLGFSDQSSFHRAFKRWAKTTPSLARKG